MRCAHLVSLAIVLFTGSGCMSLVVGYQRGQADVVVQNDDADGIDYLERKPAAARDVVVMLHGFGANKDNWDDFCAFMPKDLWLLAPDLPGFGDSVRDPHKTYDPESQVEQLARFIAARGITRFHIMGNSYGGWVASGYALAHPEQIESVVLFDPAGIEPPGGFRVPPRVRTVADFDRMLADVFATPPEMPEFLKVAMIERGIADEPFNMKIRDDIRAHPGTITEHLDALKPPVLIVWGKEDHVLNVATAPLWQAKVPSHLLVMMPKTGHAPMIERPGESAALVLTWWGRQKLLRVPS